jgi:hypothetical protein
MLNKFMMQEIIDLKLQGYTVAGIRDYYEARGIKPPSMPTIRKYYGMDVLPEDPGEKLEKPRCSMKNHSGLRSSRSSRITGTTSPCA